jgi:hypothetical protein
MIGRYVSMRVHDQKPGLSSKDPGNAAGFSLGSRAYPLQTSGKYSGGVIGRGIDREPRVDAHGSGTAREEIRWRACGFGPKRVWRVKKKKDTIHWKA